MLFNLEALHDDFIVVDAIEQHCHPFDALLYETHFSIKGRSGRVRCEHTDFDAPEAERVGSLTGLPEQLLPKPPPPEIR